jgi:hypothetical protein
MYVKVTASGPRRYLQLVESFRGDNGRPRQRTVATLGRVDELTPKDVDALINGLASVPLAGSRWLGRAMRPSRRPCLVGIPGCFGRSGTNWDCERRSAHWSLTDASASMWRRGSRVMVLNRLCDPESKLGVARAGYRPLGCPVYGPSQ